VPDRDGGPRGKDFAHMGQDAQVTGGASAAPTSAVDDPGGQVTIVLHWTETTVSRQPGETVLECARRAGLDPPFSCEEGNCGTCMAKVMEGRATMRVNDALMEDEVADGYVLTCQAIPDDSVVKVNYDE
jgi:ferredoxin